MAGSASTPWRQPPAYGRPLIGRRKAGERIGLLIVALHDGDAGRDLSARPNTARVELLEDALPHELDWSCAVALDCLLVGACDERVLWAAATMLYAAGAASLWGEFADGIYRLERWVSPLCPYGFYSDDGPIDAESLGRALTAHRAWALMRRAGVYGTPAFDAARAAEFAHTFGPLADKAQAWVAEKLGHELRRAA